ncbi:hypothetical protein DV736_g6317, partial [Chaetothyriales sp. CBS 134916]
MSSFPSSLLDPFLNALRTPASLDSTTNDHPSYYIHDPSTLVTSSEIKDFSISTGASLFSHFESVLLSAQHSLTIVTCFWARSESLKTLNHVLRTLSSRALASGNGTGKLRVRIRFSSLSVTQKLFHTRSLSGKPWPPATWVSKLGLPNPSELTGLDLEVKSIFVLPFSVMHPKFVIVDGHTVLLPSCNCHIPAPHSPQPRSTSSSSITIPSLFLPSPHHPNPDFTFPFLSAHPPPATPLNTFLLAAITHATRSVVITTPNLTSPPAISAVLSALSSGVDITIYTSARMMFLEQLLTAGTITEWCVWLLRRKYRKLLQLDNTKTARTRCGILTRWSKKRNNDSNINGRTLRDVEQQMPLQSQSQSHHHHQDEDDINEQRERKGIGRLNLFYFTPTTSPSSAQAAKLHLKFTIVDDEIVVLGSGNMDRASWYTSQELGVAFASRDFAREVQAEFRRFLTVDEEDEHEEGFAGMQMRRVI